MAARPTFLGNTAIVGVGYTPLTKASGRTVLSLATEACRNALEDAGLPAGELDGISSFSFAGDSAPGHTVATALGAERLRYVNDITMGGQAPCLLTMNAAMAVHSGVASAVLVYRALNGRSGSRVGSTGVPGPTVQYRYPIGYTAYPQYVAMWARRFMIETGATEDDLAAVAIQQRAYAARNERAQSRRPLTLEEHHAAPYVTEPFRVPDCSLEVDGACAVLVTSLERARTLRRPPAVIQAAAYARGPRSGFDTGDALLWPDLSRNYTNLLADELWSMAGVRPSEVGFAEIYDCFTSTVLFALEGLGIVGRGESGAFVRDGQTGPDGRLPVNTHGGLLCEGYVHGMNTLTEAVLQIQGRGGERQVRNAETCVVTSGALMDGSALVLSRD